ncbi:MAG: hypothetical protein IJP70_05230 [Bacteroidales bacterium]|nr:hypothetical protein [Bacteroidales bacterium]
MKLSALFLVLSALFQTIAGASYDEHHLLLDQRLSDQEAQASPYLFNEVKEALAAINATKPASPADTLTLSIAPGVYWVDDPDDPVVRNEDESEATPYGYKISYPTLKLVGLSDHPEDVVLACNRGQTQGAIGNFTMLRMNCQSIEARNITFGNYCSVDLVYPLNPKLNRPKRNKAIVQAQLVHTKADRVWADNCRFISRLNLCPFSGAHRALFTHCHFECTDDALQGSAIYSQCHFEFFSSKPFWSTPAYGAVIMDSEIDTHVSGTQYFMKSHGGITLIRTAIRQTENAPLEVLACYGKNNAPCYYSDVTLNGQPLSIRDASNISGTKLLDAFNIPNLLAGDDRWDPLRMRASVPAEQLGLPTFLQLSFTHTSDKKKAPLLEAMNDTRPVQAKLLRWGNYTTSDEDVQRMAYGSILWKASNVVRISSTGFLAADITSQNPMPTGSQVEIEAALPSGLKGWASVEVKPNLQPAPSFCTRPTLSLEKKGLQLHYALQGNGTDRTRVTWYRYDKADFSDTIAVRHGLAASEGVYLLSRADKGHRIAAVITPSFDDSEPGKAEFVTYDQEISVKLVPNILFEESQLSTDFHNVPVCYQPVIAPGTWTFDTFKPEDTKKYNWQPDPKNGWYYGYGVDGAAKKKGLVQATKGARCFYTPARDKTGNMEAVVQIAPAKTAGQGFGSATGQYMDICIKFDPHTLTGYALRIQRTPNYDHACVFQLVEYKNGQVTLLTDEQPAICYKTTCTITVSLKGTALTATALTNAPLNQPDSEEIQTEVFLKANVAKNPYAGFSIQHTGSTGASASLIEHVLLKW